jgi:nicotinate-nucleotide adenylyltransferase
MRIGIYGGTFDPIHLAHLVLAESCRDQLRLDQVWFVPAGVPPHKQSVATDGKRRREMLELALAGHAQFRIEDCELTRTGRSYTVDTLRELQSQHRGHDWWLLIGGDSLREFATWREPPEILARSRLGVVQRGLSPTDEVERRLADWPADDQSRVDRVHMPGMDVSATDLRERVGRGQSIRYLLPRAVEIYIQQHGLYRPTPAASRSEGS